MSHSNSLLNKREPCQICRRPQIEHYRLPYHAYVYSLSQRWRNLQHIDNFMNQPFHRTPPKGNPSLRLAVVDLSATAGVVFREELSITTLAKFLSSESPLPALRIFLVQDLFPDVIELLGSNFDIDPSFFSTHIYDLDWFGKSSSAATFSPSKSTLQEQQFHQFRYLQARPLRRIGQPPDAERFPCWDSNLLRNVQLMEACSTRHTIGFSRSQLTAWISPGDDGHSVAIILVDPPVKLSPTCGYEWMTNEQAPESAFDIVLHTLHHNLDSHDAITISRNLFCIIDGALQNTVMEWANVNHIIECELTKIDFEREADTKQLQPLQKELIDLHRWRRHSMKYHSTLLANLAICREKCAGGWKDSIDGQTKAEARAIDFEKLLYDLQILQTRAENQITVISAQISVQIGNLAVVEAARMRRLTIAALFFLPLSLVTGLLSMGGSFALDSGRWWVFFAVAIPLTATVVFVGARNTDPKPQLSKPKQFNELDSTWLEALGMSY